MNAVGSEIACDAGLLLAGGGLGIIGAWSMAVSTAANSADLHIWALPMYLGIGLFFLGAPIYLVGKLARDEAQPTVVNNYYLPGTYDAQPATTGTGQDSVPEKWLPSANPSHTISTDE